MKSYVCCMYISVEIGMGKKYGKAPKYTFFFKRKSSLSKPKSFLNILHLTSKQVIDTVWSPCFYYLFDIDPSLSLVFPQPCGLIFHRFFFGHVLLRHVVIFHNASTTQDSEFSHIRSQPMVLFVVIVFLNNAESIINNVRDSSYFSSSEAILKSSSNIILVFRFHALMLRQTK